MAVLNAVNERKEDFMTVLDPEYRDLFSQAQALAAKRPRLNCSPNLLNGSCTTTPLCRHCKWEGFKLQDNRFSRLRGKEEFLERGKNLEAAGIDRIFIPSGWMGYDLPEVYYDYIRDLRAAVKTELWSLMGSLSLDSLKKLQDAGLNGVLCGLESPNTEVYRRFRPGGDSLEDRLKTLENAKKLGFSLWSGFLVGLGENEKDVEAGIQILKGFEPESISILAFLPGLGTQMEKDPPANPWHWAVSMAKTRLAFPEADFFSDQTSGFMEAYGRLGGANGYYVFPAFDMKGRMLSSGGLPIRAK